MYTWKALLDDVVMSLFYLPPRSYARTQQGVANHLESVARSFILKTILGENNATHHHTILVRTKNHLGPRPGYPKTHPRALEHI